MTDCILFSGEFWLRFVFGFLEELGEPDTYLPILRKLPGITASAQNAYTRTQNSGL